MQESLAQTVGSIVAQNSRHTILYASSPLKLDPVSPPSSSGLRIIVNGALVEKDAKQLAAYASRHENVSLCVSAKNNARLDFLEHLPFLKEFDLQDFEFTHFSDFSYLPKGLEALGLCQTRAKTLSLSFLSNHPHIKRLYVESHSKDLDAVEALPALEDLTLRSITLPSLDIFARNRRLLSVDIKLGGTKNLEILPTLPELRYLELWMIRGFSDLSTVSEMKRLQMLFLQSLKGVTSLPDMRALPMLRCVHLQHMRGLRDLSPLAGVPNLERIHAIDMRHLEPEAFAILKNHRSLRTARIGLGSAKKNRAVEHLLGLPDASTPFQFVA